MRRRVIDIRDYDHERDLPAVKRIWREVGWVSDEHGEAQLDHFFAAGRTRVALINGEPECSVNIVRGSVRLDATDLDLCAVTAVTTSRIARGQSFALRLTAEQLHHAKTDMGAQVAALGIFDQGFYNKLGFGDGAYDHELTFDPAQLQVGPPPVTPPVRLTLKDSDRMHDAMIRRLRRHGAVCLLERENFRAELGFNEKAFGLGYEDADGALSHFLWIDPEGERGPYRVLFSAYQTPHQLLELFSVLKSLADQVYSVRMLEPADVQLQSLLRRPFRHRALTNKGPHENSVRTAAWWQLRILDLPSVVGSFSTPVPLRFQLLLTDPLCDHLSHGVGCHGDFIVNLGATSSIEAGTDTGLPLLTCDINAFTRLLFGIASAGSLALTDNFRADEPLTSQLEKAIRLPRPVFGWDF